MMDGNNVCYMCVYVIQREEKEDIRLSVLDLNDQATQWCSEGAIQSYSGVIRVVPGRY